MVNRRIYMQKCGDTGKSQLFGRIDDALYLFKLTAKTFPATTGGFGIGVRKLEPAAYEIS
jgi:hypothetical protein